MTTTSPVRVETLVDEMAARRPDHPALIFGERRWTYAELRVEMDRRAAVLVEAGLQPGDIVAVTGSASDDSVIAALACCRAGLISCHLSPASTSAEFIALATRAVTRLILTRDGTPLPPLSALPSLSVALPGFAGAALRAHSRRGTIDAVAVLQATSGTTGGMAKLAKRPHRALTWRRAMPPWDASPEDRTYLQRPNGANMQNCCRLFSVGATVVLASTLAPAHMEAEMARQRITALTSVPAMLRLLADRAQRPPDDLRLRVVRSSSAALSPAVARAVSERYRAPILQEYASTEGGSMIETPRGGAPMGSIGQPLSGVAVRLVDSSGDDVPTGATGELVVRSPGLMLGYCGDADATARALRDGWLWTGDLARRDGDGFYFLMGRRTLRINVGGLKVSPEEVEAVLEAHPGVREAVVLAKADARWGEVGRAVIVAQEGQPTVGELRRWCRARLAGYKVPRAWEFREELPRSPLGKVLRHLL